MGGCSLRKVTPVKVIRLATQVSRRVLDMGNEELVRMACAHHGSDEARDPFDTRKSAPSAACRGSAVFPESVDRWPGVEASARGTPGEESLEPQAEPGGEVAPHISRFGGFREPTVCRARGAPPSGRRFASVTKGGGHRG